MSFGVISLGCLRAKLGRTNFVGGDEILSEVDGSLISTVLTLPLELWPFCATSPMPSSHDRLSIESLAISYHTRWDDR